MRPTDNGVQSVWVRLSASEVIQFTQLRVRPPQTWLAFTRTCDQCTDLSYTAGKLLMQSDLNMATGWLSKQLEDLDLRGVELKRKVMECLLQLLVKDEMRYGTSAEDIRVYLCEEAVVAVMVQLLVSGSAAAQENAKIVFRLSLHRAIPAQRRGRYRASSTTAVPTTSLLLCRRSLLRRSSSADQIQFGIVMEIGD
ncbi:hypothetical protein L1887_10102 [Cichorium endivia]|nr:hypothetical protein L1887_10102 [Cichorium endivia]